MRAEATQLANIKNAKTMLDDNLPLELIAKYSGLSLVMVKELAEERKNQTLSN